MDNWAQIEFLFLYRLHLSKKELRKLEFWDVEQTLELWKEQAEKEKEEHEKQEREYKKQYEGQKISQAKAKMPSVNYGGYKIPKSNIPIPKGNKF